MAFPSLEVLRRKLNDAARDNRGVPVKHVRVVSCSGRLSRAERFLAFGQQAASYVVPLIKQARTCAVAWGRTVNCVVEAVPKQSTPSPTLRFMPISGEPINHTDTGVSPSTAAKKLAQAFGCDEHCLSLQGVAARIPKEFDASAKTIRRFVNMCRAYEEIFGGKDPLIDNVDLIVSGIGDIDSSTSDPWFRETAECEGINDLSQIAAGNVGGVWIPKDPRSTAQSRRIAQVNQRWLGIQREHFENCARRGDRRDGGPGVVVLALEPAKAAIVLRAMGMVNHLIIEHDLAEAILNC
jgi:DNA-binding transcriptional regulator LsrR (DeoR family)